MRFVTAAELVREDLDTDVRRSLKDLACHSRRIAWFGRSIEVCFDEPDAAQIFHERYQAFATTLEPSLRAYAVASHGSTKEPIFFCDPGEAYRYPAPLRGGVVIAFLADAVVQRAFFDVHPDIVSFHAAAVKVDGVAAAISATSTGGKSTTAIACARRGMGLFTDERCVVKDGLVQAFPRAVNIRSGGLELLADVIDPETGVSIGERLRARSNEWMSASFSDVLGPNALPTPAPLDALFFIIGRGRIAHVEALPRQDAIVQLLHAGLCGSRPGLDRVAAATSLCRSARAYSLVLGTPDDTALVVAATTRRAHPLIAVRSA